MPLGNLRTLAASISTDPWIKTQTPDTLDMLFRPALHRLLAALHTMHDHYGLCHDDIKLENILATHPQPPPAAAAAAAAAAAEWYLADFNSVRHVHHPYHATALWHYDNGQLRDCRANDVRRLLRTYAQFLRGCLSGHRGLRAAFDADFMARMKPWSRLYWVGIQATGGRYGESASVADLLRSLSERYSPETAENSSVGAAAGGMGEEDRSVELLAREVKEELKRTMWVDVNHVKERGLTWLLGAPRGAGC